MLANNLSNKAGHNKAPTPPAAFCVDNESP